MRSSRPQLDPQRLMQAAEAALYAAKDVQEHKGGPLPYPADLMGSPLQPDCLGEFTKFEIEEASQFLVRMGEIEAPRKGNPKR